MGSSLMWVLHDAGDRIQVAVLVWHLRHGRPLPGDAVRGIRTELARMARRRGFWRGVAYVQFATFDACVTAAAYAFAVLLRFGDRIPPAYAQRLPVVLVGV